MAETQPIPITDITPFTEEDANGKKVKKAAILTLFSIFISPISKLPPGAENNPGGHQVEVSHDSRGQIFRFRVVSIEGE